MINNDKYKQYMNSYQFQGNYPQNIIHFNQINTVGSFLLFQNPYVANPYQNYRNQNINRNFQQNQSNSNNYIIPNYKNNISN